MEDNRLVPYSVHLKRDIYDKLKLAAGQRKASSLVRDAITFIIEGDDEFNGGYNKGIRDAISVIRDDSLSGSLSFNGVSLDVRLAEKLEEMIVIKNNMGKKIGKEKA